MLEMLFFASLGITFVMIVFLVYQFRQKFTNLEHKCDTMFEIINNMVKEMNHRTTLMDVAQFAPNNLVLNSHSSHNDDMPKLLVSDSEEEDLQELITPLFQMYVSVIEMLTVFSQMVLPLFSEDIKSYLKSVSRLDTKYKVGKDESPVMDSYFGCWKLFDARIGKRKETLAQVALELSDSFHEDPNVLDLIQKMCDSYMGIYVHEGFEGDMVLLRDVITDVVKPSFNPSVYRGEKGELWFTRLLPHPEDNEYVSITTPYIIEATEDEWLEFFATKGVVKGHLNAEEKYIELMKRGKTRNYWTNYVVEEYVDDLDQAILLGGVPKK